MHAQLSNLLEQHMARIVHHQLLFSALPPSATLTSIAREIFQSLVTGILLNQTEPLYCFTLIYRLVHKCDQLPTISSQTLLQWIQDGCARAYCLKLVAKCLLQMGYSSHEPQHSDGQILDAEVLEREAELVQREQVEMKSNQQKIIEFKETGSGELQQGRQQPSPCHHQILPSNQPSHHSKEQLPHAISPSQESLDISIFLQNQHHQVQQQFELPQLQQLQIKQQSNPQNKNQQQHQEQQQEQQEEEEKSQPLHQHFTPNVSFPLKDSRKNSFQSLNNDPSQSSPEHIKTLKLTDARRVGQQQQVSEVSSFFNESQFISSSLYNVQDTNRYGHFLYGDKVDIILRSFISNSCIFLLVRWKTRKNGEVPVQSILESVSLKEHCPQRLIEFYENMKG